jgi:hypothetical protein
VDMQTRPWHISPSGSYQYVSADLLEGSVPGFQSGKPTILMVTYKRGRKRSYHWYSGGPHWVATLPRRCLGQVDTHAVRITIPSTADFINGLPSFALAPATIRFRRTRVRVGSFELSGNELRILLSQNPPIEGQKSLLLDARILDDMACFGGVARIKFLIKDFFGRELLMAVYHDGYSRPFIGVKSNHSFYAVTSACFDGIRIGFRFHYRKSNPNVVTLYSASPSGSYKVTRTSYANIDFHLRGVKKGQTVVDLNLLRSSDRLLLLHGGNYHLGRIGAEVAYTIANEVLSMKGVVLNEPSQGGKDLFTTDGRVVIQTRLLARTWYETTEQLGRDLHSELTKLVQKLGQDFRYNPSAVLGYAILTYARRFRAPRSIVLEISRPVSVRPNRDVGPAGFELATTPASGRLVPVSPSKRMSRLL